MSAAELAGKFDEVMTGLLAGETPPSLALALSGGSDSMALALLLDRWTKVRGIALHALTVDHGLRDNSAAEANSVAEAMAGCGISHEILTWRGPHPLCGIQARARDARYHLMAEYCACHGITHLLLGHQMEDRLETLLMRLSRGSGLEGLVAIRPRTNRGGLTLLRPLLDMKREELRDFLRAAGQSWIEDPSNENPRFTRTHAGALLHDLRTLPESSLETIALSADRLGRAAAALDQLAEAAFRKYSHISPFGFVDIPLAVLERQPAEIGLRFFAHAIEVTAGGEAAFRLRSLEALYERMIRGDQTAETLGGCDIRPERNRIRISREPGRKGLPVARLEGALPILWDGRYHVTDTLNHDAHEKFSVRRIGSEGWRILKDQPMSPEEKALPARVRDNLPAIWSGEKLVAAPLFSCNFAQSSIAKNRFKMVFRPLIP